jgi:hypothetical protein
MLIFSESDVVDVVEAVDKVEVVEHSQSRSERLCLMHFPET